MSKTLEIVLLKDLRVSFVGQVFNKGEYNGTPNSKYSCVLIFDKPVHNKLVKGLQGQIQDLIDSELKGDEPEDRYMVLKDDDSRTKKGNRPEYKGLHTMKVSNKNRPITVDQKKNPVTEDDGLFYSGCRVNAQVSLWANDGKNGAVVGCNLIALQFAGDDEPLGDGGVDTEEVLGAFEEVEGDDPFA